MVQNDQTAGTGARRVHRCKQSIALCDAGLILDGIGRVDDHAGFSFLKDGDGERGGFDDTGFDDN
jgi:hypothetical protein